MARYLRREGYDVETTHDGEAALDASARRLPDLVVLDLMLPNTDGIEVFRRLRLLGSIPVVMLTALGESDDRIAGLELGADDYVAKPFSPREVTARIAAVLKRSRAASALPERHPLLSFGDVVVDAGARRACKAGVEIEFTPRELDLLIYFTQNPGAAFRREELLEAVWGWTYGDSSTVTVHVRRLRGKIEVEPSRPEHIVTVWGVGYRFDL